MLSIRENNLVDINDFGGLLEYFTFSFFVIYQLIEVMFYWNAEDE